jgi:hypothetical protein
MFSLTIRDLYGFDYSHSHGRQNIVPIEKTEVFEEGLAWVMGQHDVDVVGMSV